MITYTSIHIFIVFNQTLSFHLPDSTPRNIPDIPLSFSYRVGRSAPLRLRPQYLRPVLFGFRNLRNEHDRPDIRPERNRGGNYRYNSDFLFSFLRRFTSLHTITYSTITITARSAMINLPGSGSPSASEQARNMPIRAKGDCLGVSIILLCFLLKIVLYSLSHTISSSLVVKMIFRPHF